VIPQFTRGTHHTIIIGEPHVKDSIKGICHKQEQYECLYPPWVTGVAFSSLAVNGKSMFDGSNNCCRGGECVPKSWRSAGKYSSDIGRGTSPGTDIGVGGGYANPTRQTVRPPNLREPTEKQEKNEPRAGPIVIFHLYKLHAVEPYVENESEELIVVNKDFYSIGSRRERESVMKGRTNGPRMSSTLTAA